MADVIIKRQGFRNINETYSGKLCRQILADNSQYILGVIGKTVNGVELMGIDSRLDDDTTPITNGAAGAWQAAAGAVVTAGAGAIQIKGTAAGIGRIENSQIVQSFYAGKKYRISGIAGSMNVAQSNISIFAIDGTGAIRPLATFSAGLETSTPFDKTITWPTGVQVEDEAKLCIGAYTGQPMTSNFVITLRGLSILTVNP